MFLEINYDVSEKALGPRGGGFIVGDIVSFGEMMMNGVAKII